MVLVHYKYTLSCGLFDRYCLSGHRCHLEGPVRPVQEAQRAMTDKQRGHQQPEMQTGLTIGGVFGQLVVSSVCKLLLMLSI